MNSQPKLVPGKAKAACNIAYITRQLQINLLKIWVPAPHARYALSHGKQVLRFFYTLLRRPDHLSEYARATKLILFKRAHQKVSTVFSESLDEISIAVSPCFDWLRAMHCCIRMQPLMHHCGYVISFMTFSCQQTYRIQLNPNICDNHANSPHHSITLPHLSFPFSDADSVPM